MVSVNHIGALSSNYLTKRIIPPDSFGTQSQIVDALLLSRICSGRLGSRIQIRPGGKQEARDIRRVFYQQLEIGRTACSD